MPTKSYAHRGVDRFDNEAVFVDVFPSEHGVCYRYVFCDDENYIEFHHLDYVEGTTPKIVSLRSVLETDESLVEIVAKLEPGMRASRTSKESAWAVSIEESDEFDDN